MALISQSTYNPHLLFKSKHLNTIYRTLFHKIEVGFQRERMETSDGDFMDLDFSHVDSDRLVIIIHGLEGSSGSKYVTAMTQVANRAEFDRVHETFVRHHQQEQAEDDEISDDEEEGDAPAPASPSA